MTFELQKPVRPWVRIVLFSFLLCLILLVLYGPRIRDSQNKIILIGDADVAQLMVGWQRTWQRAPTEEEMRGLLEKYVQDEVVYREALEQGLDKNNGIVKRSLITQMNLLAEVQPNESQILDTDIEAYYALRKDQFEEPPSISFSQIYFDPGKHKQALDQDIDAVLKELTSEDLSPTEAQNFGDQILLDDSYTRESKNEISNQFGEEFAKSIFDQPTNTWTGPLESGYGWHLVYVTEKNRSTSASLESVKNEIIREIQYEQKEATKEQFYTELKRQYKIVYEGMAKEFVDDP